MCENFVRRAYCKNFELVIVQEAEGFNSVAETIESATERVYHVDAVTGAERSLSAQKLFMYTALVSAHDEVEKV